MSSLMNRKSVRNELLKKLQDLGRKVSTQTVFLHQAIAQSVGLNATDTKCIDLILSQADGSVTAGWLSDVSGLTTGAITHILDRLEKRQFLERVRDTQDRRKIFVRIRPESLKPLLPKYEEIGNAYMNLTERYSDADLQVICDYMERASEVAGRQLASFIADGDRPSPPSSNQVHAQRHRVGPRKMKGR
jgi:DNA-binding MarR family transcriptional regulator